MSKIKNVALSTLTTDDYIYTILPDRKAAVAWFRQENNSWCKPNDEYTGNRTTDRDEDFYQSLPASYPCLAFDTVADWGMEESRPVYIYPADVQVMAKALEEAGA